MKTNSCKLYLQFYRSTLIINNTFSISASILFYSLSGIPMIYSFSMFFMTFGFFVAILVKESTFVNKTEYYFYYNYGISKIKLLIISTIINFMIGIILIIGYQYA